jgi:hypothetical protein
MNSNTSCQATPEQVEAYLKQRLGRRIRELRVVLHEGRLILKGQVASYYAKQLAQHAAMRANGLAIRANEIEVLGTSAVSEPDHANRG